MHDVSVRSASNRMDEHNLAVVICPNLVKGANPALDVMMCAVSGLPSLFKSRSTGMNSDPISEGRTTLGMVIVLCIKRYYEVFDETPDRTEAIPPQRRIPDENEASSSRSGSASPSPIFHDEDEDIDDAMLVMPLGPSHSSNGSVQHTHSPPSAWTSSNGVSGTSTPRSMHTIRGENGNSGLNANYQFPTNGKAKSMINIEKAGTVGGGRKGSISVGRGTTRKSSGAGVEALSVTAEGFFSAPSDTLPLPSRDRRWNGDVS